MRELRLSFLLSRYSLDISRYSSKLQKVLKSF
ncbi:hypothetical protein BRC2024_OFSGVTRC_CDS_0047 [Acinetobacter phage vB_AbaM_Rocket]